MKLINASLGTARHRRETKDRYVGMSIQLLPSGQAKCKEELHFAAVAIKQQRPQLAKVQFQRCRAEAGMRCIMIPSSVQLQAALLTNAAQANEVELMVTAMIIPQGMPCHSRLSRSLRRQLASIALAADSIQGISITASSSMGITVLFCQDLFP